jgi:hyperosmotically inducible protein
MKSKRIGIFVVLCVLMAFAACNTPGGRSAGQVVDDATITTKVKTKLFQDDLLDGFAISVQTFSGKVTLIGAVDTSSQKGLAESRARSVIGVVGVNNLLEVKKP